MTILLQANSVIKEKVMKISCERLEALYKAQKALEIIGDYENSLVIVEMRDELYENLDENL